ncbi:MAG: N-(5'-phosphoribosyl)anthranilate isomerase [Acidobacteria bacterium]|nr:MAG: N-(5'-phosphoribosyl)anthranilate isomerase [Acidobacteriota bacterium]
MITQIYTMQTIEEALAIIDAGVDHLGITPGENNLPGEVGYEKAFSIFDAVKGKVTRVALTVSTDINEIVQMVQAVQPDILHICGPSSTIMPPAALYQLRRRLPGIRIMQAISVADRSAVSLCMKYQDAADIIILDTEVSTIGGVGASGATHDWSISREIVQRSKIPVILAGGLSADNVEAAVKAVRPWGVDSLTHTNRPLENGGFRKDINKIRQFVVNANNADKANKADSAGSV